jgi:hypothetical protein
MGSVVPVIKVGVRKHEIERLIADAMQPYQVHPVIARAFAQRMGLALEEPPYTDVGETFEEGEVYSIRIGATDGSNGGMICSTMIHAGKDGTEEFDDGQQA